MGWFWILCTISASAVEMGIHIVPESPTGVLKMSLSVFSLDNLETSQSIYFISSALEWNFTEMLQNSLLNAISH